MAGVYSDNFPQFAKLIVEDIKDLIENGRKVPLTYEGYRSHLGRKVLWALEQGGVIALALSAHTSGRAQPLDLSVFPPLKRNLNEIIRRHSRSDFRVE